MVKTGLTENVKNIAVGQANLRSVLQVVANTLYDTSTVKNSGPLPPQAGKITTYALKYFIKNSGNDLSDIKLKIPLERSVKLTEITSGISLNEWEYDEDTHTITVHIPSLTASGLQSGRSIELQVAVKPEAKDVGRHVTLAKRATYTALDIFVNEVFEGSVGKLTTQITAEETRGTKVENYQQELTPEEKTAEMMKVKKIP